MAEIKTVSRVSLLQTLLTFKQGECLELKYQDFGISTTQSLRVLINTLKRAGEIPRDWKFQITEFKDPARLFVLRKQ